MWIVGDLHFRACTRTEDRQLIDILVSYFQAHDEVVLLGDVLDGKAIVHTHALHTAHLLFDAVYQKTGQKPILVLGNHDIDSETRSLLNGHNTSHPYIGMDNVIVIDKPTVIGNDLFCPYTPKGELYETCIRYVDCTSHMYNRLFCHQEFAGVNMGIISEHGDAHLPPCRIVVSGHIHQRQNLIVDGRNVWYIGSPRTTNFGDESPKVIGQLCDGKLTEYAIDFMRHQTFSATIDELKNYDEQTFEALVTKLSKAKARIIIEFNSMAEWKEARMTMRMRAIANVAKIIPKIQSVAQVITHSNKRVGFWQSFDRIASERAKKLLCEIQS